jgi:hypothetical protein
MSSETRELKVQIVRFVDDRFPGWVEGQFVDADGRVHAVVDKFPIFTTEVLTAESCYPSAGNVRCNVLRLYRNDGGGELALIKLNDVVSTAGLSEFVVLASQLTK